MMILFYHDRLARRSDGGTEPCPESIFGCDDILTLKIGYAP